jgi:hypothetical protein
MSLQDKITWLRCFDDDEADQRMANQCANTIEEMRSALENIIRRSKNATETCYIHQVAQEALSSVNGRKDN